ncbi:putative quercetin 2,3-dioxygenase [Psychromonas marina]|uniref:Quercetin 2,3-dioxygenase n=1 Tax=Psychromonas marina TaxID=88364 RepID=A0ABQ6E5V8_9GAMM|nr:pirin-like bicupin family protein [Psychromonas marina]GLS92585.1 putative quercetin 2,3-dioxygenase [Psychromonas marina]
MIKHIQHSQLGRGEHGWLSSRFHFSFANYYDPNRMGFGKLRVINDDLIKAGYGFDAHPHRNMEIITYVRSGEVSHQDSQGNKGVTKAGEVQVMSAGSGIVHSEYNLSLDPLVLYQIWIETEVNNVTPRWQTLPFTNKEQQNKLSLLVSGYQADQYNKQILSINQQARIFTGRLTKGSRVEHPLDHQAYLLAAEGQFIVADGVKDELLNKGDGAEVTAVKTIIIEAVSDCELLLIDTP